MTNGTRSRSRITISTLLLSASLALTGLLACGTTTEAAPVFVQMTLPPVGEFFSYSILDGELTADDFVLGSTQTIQAITWQGENGPGGAPGPDAFHINFYTDPIGGAGSLVASFNLGAANRSEAGFTIPDTGDLVYNYWANLGGAGFVATAGTRYWISIVNDALVDPADLWTWAGGFNGTAAGSFNNGASWFTQDASLNFTLNNAQLPEPATLGLVAIGLIGIARARAQRRSGVPNAVSTRSR
jgi:PEP-CTERM motif